MDDFLKACANGDLAQVQNLFKSKNMLNIALPYACGNGHLHVVKFLISKGVSNWDEGLTSACGGGHLKIAELMIFKGANDLT